MIFKDVKQHRNLSIGLGAILIILGLIGIVAPAVTTFVVQSLIGFLLIVAGIVLVFYALYAPKLGGFLLRIIAGGIIVAIGILMLKNPFASVLTLSMLLMMYFIFGGIFYIINAFHIRPSSGWSFQLFNGVISLLLGWLIWSQWPISATWVLGLFVGIVLFIQGFSLLMAGLAKD